MVRLVETDEALRVQRRGKQLGRIVDLDDVVEGRVHDQQRLAQGPDTRRQIVLLEVVEELPLHRERAPANVHLGDALVAQRVFRAGQQVADVGRVRRRADGRHGDGRRNLGRCLEDGCAAERMAEQDLRRPVMFLEKPDGGEQVADIRREIRVREVAFALAEAGEIEAQHGDARIGQRPRDVRRGFEVLGAGETMREQRIGLRFGLRQGHEPGQ